MKSHLHMVSYWQLIAFRRGRLSFLEGCVSSDKLTALQAKLHTQEYVAAKIRSDDLKKRQIVNKSEVSKEVGMDLGGDWREKVNMNKMYCTNLPEN